MPAQQQVDVAATPEEVWEALVTEEGRERWLGEPERDIHIEVLDAPNRLVWWWTDAERPTTRVEFLIVAVPAGGSRVIVRESEPSFPLALLASAFAMVPA
jgi:uncharacterized protein YndB with AHSA1/START domain